MSEAMFIYCDDIELEVMSLRKENAALREYIVETGGAWMCSKCGIVVKVPNYKLLNPRSLHDHSAIELCPGCGSQTIEELR